MSTKTNHTLITPERIYRVQGTSYGAVENAATAAGLAVLGIHRDGDEGFYDPRPSKARRRETAVSRAFSEGGAA